MAKPRTGSIHFYHNSDFVYMYHERSHKGGKEEIILQIQKQKTKGKFMQVKEQELTSAISGVDSALLT